MSKVTQRREKAGRDTQGKDRSDDTHVVQVVKIDNVSSTTLRRRCNIGLRD